MHGESMNRALAVLLVFATSAVAQETPAPAGPPSENRYDIVWKMLKPFFSVLLEGGQSPDKAASFHMTMTEVTGRLPKDFNGATLDAAVQFPNKVKLTAPVLGEQVTVCRNGNDVWAVPGEKIEYLLKQFAGKLPAPTKKKDTPLFIPITAQQAVFLPALFTFEEGKQFEDLNGEKTRVITGGLMPELGKVTKAEDFRATMWVAEGYIPRQIKITRRDFTATVTIEDLKFQPKLPGKTWLPPEGATNVYHTTPEVLEQLLFVVMNSVNLKTPGAAEPAAPLPAPQQP
jgi:outer membrane lipoprotein-sorting protein